MLPDFFPTELGLSSVLKMDLWDLAAETGSGTARDFCELPGPKLTFLDMAKLAAKFCDAPI